MKHKTGDRVLVYLGGVQLRARVTDASREHVTVRLLDGRELTAWTHADVARISPDRGRRR